MPSREAMYDELQTLRAKLKELKEKMSREVLAHRDTLIERQTAEAKLKEAEDQSKRRANLLEVAHGEVVRLTRALEEIANWKEWFSRVGRFQTPLPTPSSVARAALEDSATDHGLSEGSGRTSPSETEERQPSVPFAESVYDESLEGAARFALAVLETDVKQMTQWEGAAKCRWTAVKKLRAGLSGATVSARESRDRPSYSRGPAESVPPEDSGTERCPTCGSGDPEVRGEAWKPSVPGVCPDPWHEDSATEEESDAS